MNVIKLKHAIAFIVGIIVLSLLPWVTDRNDVITWGCTTLMFLISAQAWNIIGGLAGQENLGHAAFFGLGALVTRLLWTYGWPYILAILAGSCSAMIFALIIGLPAFRLRGVYFIIGTLVLAEILRVIFETIMPHAMVMPTKLLMHYDLTPRYFLSLGLAALAVAAVYWIKHNKLGLVLMSIREDEVAAEASGVDTQKYKMIAFAISTFMAGLAGGYYAYFSAAMQPGALFAPEWTFDAVLITFVGGVGTIAGPIIGSVFFVLLRQVLSLYLPSGMHVLVFGVLFIIVVLFLPGGLNDIFTRLRGKLIRTGGQTNA
jgi:branched-chain amino acid transport system permease protein